MPIPLSNDRRELMRKIASEGVKIEALKIKVAKLPHGPARNGALVQLGEALQRQDARLLRVWGKRDGV